MPFGMSQGLVKPLGKTHDYDKQFEQTLEDCSKALIQESIEILGKPHYTENITIGATPVPE